MHPSQLSPLATALCWPQQTPLSGETEPLVINALLSLGLLCLPTSGHHWQASIDRPKRQHVSTRISPDLRGKTTALPPPDNHQLPPPNRGALVWLAGPWTQGAQSAPEQLLKVIVQWDSHCAPREGVPPLKTRSSSPLEVQDGQHKVPALVRIHPEKNH